MKKCSSCLITKPKPAFYKFRRCREVLSTCKECRRKKHPIEVSAGIFDKRQRIEELQRIVVLAKSKPCMDCEVEHPPHIMEFDHRDPNTKIAEVGFFVRKGYLRGLLEEIDKCDVVCSNCHKQRTWLRRKYNV